MKKFYMMFAAIITLAAISFVSCGSDDNDSPTTYKEYTLKTEVDLGSLTGEAAATLKGLESSNTAEFASEADAIAEYENIVAKGKELIEYTMKAVYLASGGVKDFKVYVKLYDAKGKEIKKTTYSF